MFAADGFCTQEMTTLGLICLALFAVQLYLSDIIMRDPRRIIWTRRQTTRWQQMVRDMDFACEIYELELRGHSGGL